MKRMLEILNGLANETRLKIFLILLEEDFCVCELQEILGIEQSRLSHQLRILRYLGLVETRQEGKWAIYFIPEEMRKNRIIQSIKESIELPAEEREKISEVKVSSIRAMKNK